MSPIVINIYRNFLSVFGVVDHFCSTFPCMFQLLHDRCCYFLNFLCYPWNFSLHRILESFLTLFDFYTEHFQSFPLPQASFIVVSYAILPTLWPLLPPRHCWNYSLDDIVVWTAWSFSIFVNWKWCKDLVQSIALCMLCWPWCWATCWIWQAMEHIEASWVFNVNVGGFEQLKQSKISGLNITSFGIFMQTVSYDTMVSCDSYKISAISYGNCHRMSCLLKHVISVQQCGV